MARQIVQISTCEAVDTDFNEHGSTVALCNDGTLWLLSFNYGWNWRRLPGVPQGFVKQERMA